MTNGSTLITVIIPTLATETNWPELIPSLKPIANHIEVIVAVPRPALFTKEYLSIAALSGIKLRVLETELGRAKQMNAAVQQAQAKYLWFLHADSRLSCTALERAVQLTQQGSSDIFYFDLVFHSDGPRLTFLNQIGAYIRSRFFGLPFGDQGFLLSHEIFNKLGQFPEGCKYGEDHLLIWQAKRARVRVVPARAQIVTSARRYQSHGWLRTTCRHNLLFSAQVLNELRIPKIKLRA